jgi:hypothetical protein
VEYPPDGSDIPDELVNLFSSTEEPPPAPGDAETIDPTLAEADGAAGEPTGDGSYTSALYGDAPAEQPDTPTDTEIVSSPAEEDSRDSDHDEETIPGLSTVTNPALTVSVSAMMGGATLRVDLSPELRGMNESRLADEICALADLARLKGQASMLTGMLADPGLAERARELDLDPREAIPDIFDRVGMALPTPEQAAAAQAEVFATRYTADM